MTGREEKEEGVPAFGEDDEAQELELHTYGLPADIEDELQQGEYTYLHISTLVTCSKNTEIGAIYQRDTCSELLTNLYVNFPVSAYVVAIFACEDISECICSLFE